MLQERPIGELWAWLHVGMQGRFLTKEEHCGFHPSHAERAAARLEFEAGGADVQQWLTAECGGVGLGEPLENRHSRASVLKTYASIDSYSLRIDVCNDESCLRNTLLSASG